MLSNTIYTVDANCQDCYRCVRVCPVKAIRVSGNQARVRHELCIQCGTCVRECPQQAKRIRSDLDKAKELLAAEQALAASIAPSFAAWLGASLRRRLPSVLRQLGFRYVSETAEGAKYVTERSFAEGQTGNICTACPTVVHYIEKYRPELFEYLIPVVSPMIAHGRMLKERYPGAKVIFFGPCAAKKEEILRPENAGAVDLVLTFTELEQWLQEKDLALENCAESGFDQSFPIGDARLFPLDGGMLKTGGIHCDASDQGSLRLSGADDIITLFGDKKVLQETGRIEPLFCKGGCISGPAFPSHKSMFERRRDVIAYWENAKEAQKQKPSDVSHRADFRESLKDEVPVTESQIQKILEQTGKIDPALQLNCGACGYKSCEENAIAIVRGMAEPEMCSPYMRRMAQQRTDRIIETAPSGIVIVDSDLRMIKMNPSFQKMFICNNGILGRRISYLVNAEGYEALQSGALEQWEAIRTKYIRYHEIIYPLREDEQYVGIYTDISNLSLDNRQIDVIKTQTVQHAREFLAHQIKFAQEMAHYLGRSTAQSEEIAKRLISLYENEAPEGEA